MERLVLMSGLSVGQFSLIGSWYFFVLCMANASVVTHHFECVRAVIAPSLLPALVILPVPTALT